MFRWSIVLVVACALLASCGEEAAVDGLPPAVTSTTVTADTPAAPGGSPAIEDGGAEDAGEEQEAMDDGTTVDDTVPTTTEPDPSAPASAGGSVVEVAKADLSGRLSVPASQITLVSYTDVVWRDGSLGCPEPGYAYTQALVAGYRIVFDVDGMVFEYHGAGTNPPRYCAEPSEPFKGGSGGPDT